MAAYYPPSASGASTPGTGATPPTWGVEPYPDTYPTNEMEMEVDELKSDSEAGDLEQTLEDDTPYYRPPGQSTLPASRLQHIIQAESASGALTLLPDALWMISVAAEEFIRRIALAGHEQALAQQRGQIEYTDMALTAQQYQEYAFLRDIIPEPMSLEAALRARVEKAETDEDPAAAGPIISSALSAFIPPKNAPPPPKPAKSTRGKKERANGSTATSNRKRGAVPDDDGDFGGGDSSDGAFHGRNTKSTRAGQSNAHASISAVNAPRLRTTRATTQSASASNNSSPFTTTPLPPFSGGTPEDLPYLPPSSSQTLERRSVSGTPSDGPFLPPPPTQRNGNGNGASPSHPPDLPHGRTIYSQRPE